MSDNIVLVGFMGAGKDTVGMELSRCTGMPLLSTDAFIELTHQRSIKEIFSCSGEAFFRDCERRALTAFEGITHTIIATGGGMVKSAINRHLLSRMGAVVYLKTDAETIEERLAHDTERPLIIDRGSIRRLLAERKSSYDFADITIDTGGRTVSSIAHELMRKLQCARGDAPVKRKTIMVEAVAKPYPVHIGYQIIQRTGHFLKTLISQRSKVMVVSNPLVFALYGAEIQDILTSMGCPVKRYIVPDGEYHKTLDSAAKLYDILLGERFSRSDTIIALGGGVIGDLAGFVASTYKRGCGLVQVPTTLLAQVDASVGGKTAVNHPLGKNMIGTFYQPSGVIVDTRFLKTLSNRQFANGIAEVIKYAVVTDCGLFATLKKKRHEILAREQAVLAGIIDNCIRIKASVVVRDEREERGVREVLNFGHTVGHIIETLSGYGQLTHGEAVAIGMAEECRWAQECGSMSKDDAERVREVIASFALPVAIPGQYEWSSMREMLFHDKKVRNSSIRLPVPTGIGSVSMKEMSCDAFV